MRSMSKSCGLPRRKGAGPTRQEVEDAFDTLEARGEAPSCREVEKITGGTTEVVRQLVSEVKANRRLELEREPLTDEFLSAAKALALGTRKAVQREAEQDVKDAEERASDDSKRASELREKLDLIEEALQEERANRIATEKLLEAEKESHEATKRLHLDRRDALGLAKHQIESLSAELAFVQAQLNATKRDQDAERSQADSIQGRAESISEALQTERATRLAKEQLLQMVTESLETERAVHEASMNEVRQIIADRDGLRNDVLQMRDELDKVQGELQAEAARAAQLERRAEDVARHNGSLMAHLKLAVKRLRSHAPEQADEFEIDHSTP